jgi:pyruvate/2-oxoacid:ferredoxin oxidoreductase alpha subunit
MTAQEIDKVLENPENFMNGELQGFNSNVEYQVPVLALYDYIEKYTNSSIVNEIVITNDDNENISNNTEFTKEINYRRTAARLYFEQQDTIINIMNNTVTNLI